MKICPAELTTILACAIVFTAESGIPLIKEFVLRTFGTANWNSILSRHDFLTGNYRRRQD
jgi:hypothetical protein